MKANPEILILEDEPAELEQLHSQLAAKGFHVLAVRSASRAIAALRDGGQPGRPVVAIVDWDLSRAPDQSATATDALCVLAREAADCLAIVYTANADFFRVRSDIQRAHPRAWLHDKREGGASLMTRIGRMLDQSVADIQIKNGSLVVHVPSGDAYHHREAVRLLVRHPEVVTLQSETATRAVRRFGAWLQQHGSAVRVVSHGNRRYRLAVATAAPPVEASASRP